MNNPYTHIDIDCWDYCFNKSGHQTVWFGTSKQEDNGSVITFATNNGWRFLFLSDTRDGLLEDIEQAKIVMPSLVDVHDVYPVSTQLHAILQYWRMIRYNSRNICAMQTNDFYPENPCAWPGGPIAPIRNAFVYTAVHKTTNELVSITIDMAPKGKENSDFVDLPIVSSSITKLINEVGLAGCDADELINNYHIVARNVCDLSADHFFVYWSGMPFPLLGVIALNPNHNNDPEENLLASTS